ncbi:MAG: hypothetical protein K9M45_04405 [Kiritimatiellales bacterium]|nr:hypothetical protein [Kiritimatiellales bacterium]
MKRGVAKAFCTVCLLMSVLAFASAQAADTFGNWAQQYIAASGQDRLELEPEGIELAKLRREAMLSLIRSDPAAAIAQAIAPELSRQLPLSIRRYLERPVGGPANNTPFRPAAKGAAPENGRDIIIKGQSFRAYVYGTRSEQALFSNSVVSGIAIGSELALADLPGGQSLADTPRARKARTARNAAKAKSRSGTVSEKFRFIRDDLTLGTHHGFDTVSLKDCELPEDEPGTPWLPARYVNVEIPYGASADDVSIQANEILIATGLTLYPAQPPQPLSQPYTGFTKPRADAYARQNRFPDEPGKQTGPAQRMRGRNFVPVRINPLRYVPASGELYLSTEIEISVAYTSPLTAPPVSTADLQEMEEPAAVPLDAPSATVDYLFITKTSLLDEFQILANHRTTHSGLSTEVIDTTWVTNNYSMARPDGGSDMQTAIRNCISDYVASSGTLYVALGGDNTIVPDRDTYIIAGSYTNSTMPTDLYYSGLDGNWDDYDSDGVYGEVNVGGVSSHDEGDLSPDVIVGRIPVRNSTQSMAYINKLIDFETNPPYDKLGKFMMGGHKLWNNYFTNDRPSDVMYDGHMAFQDENHPIVSDAEMWMRRAFRDRVQIGWEPDQTGCLFNTLTSWDATTAGDYAASGDNMVTRFSEGWNFTINATHGSTTSLSGENNSFTATKALTLTGLTTIFYTMACNSGGFDNGNPSVSEAMLINPDGGALAYFGCSRFGWGSPNAPPAKNTTTGGTSSNYMRKFLELIFMDKIYDLGQVFADHKAAYIGSSGGNGATRWVQLGMNYQGDPAFQIQMPPDVQIKTDTSDIDVPEGGTATFNVKLAENPVFATTVTVARVSGDADISVSGGATLIFDAFNWSTYQPVTLAAAHDADDLLGTAVIECSAPGAAPATVTATEFDDEHNFAPSVSIDQPAVRLVAVPSGCGLMLDTTVTDDGKPGGPLSVSWSMVRGPGAVAFSPSNAADTAATFPADGGYVLRLTASDGEKQTIVELQVNVGVASAGGAQPSGDMVVYYPFDNSSGSTVPDAAGGDNPGNLSGGTWIPEAGMWNGALELDGSTNDHVHIPDSADINTGANDERTVALWFRADDLGAGKRQMLFEEGGNTRGLNIYLDGSTLYVGGWNNGENGWSTTFLNVSGLETGLWYHAALVLEGTTSVQPDAFRGYLNGELFGSGNGATINAHSDDNGIGAVQGATKCHDGKVQDGATTAYFDGVVDDFMLCNRVLSAAEIAGLGRPLQAGPAVDAGPNQTVAQTARMEGQVSDDTVPTGSIATEWLKISGPGQVAFTDADQPETWVCFDTAGNYTLRLTASDGEVTTFDEVSVNTAGSGSLPSSFIQSPTNGSVYCLGSNIAVTATGFSLANVVALTCDANTSAIGSGSDGLLEFTWTHPALGSYNLTARCTDANGTTVTSSVVAVTVAADTDHDGLPNPIDPDDDNDGLSDAWETLKGLNSLSAEGDDGADADPDEDGMTNSEEFTADTHPLDPASVLCVIGFETTPSGMEIRWTGGEQACQELECASFLTPATEWMRLHTNLPPTAVTNMTVLPSPTNDVMFFRIRAYRP